MFTFTKDCLIGVPEIDEEHQKLFQLIEEVDAAVKSDADSLFTAMGLITELKQYAVTHFADEENYMREIGYEGLAQQEILHQKFINTLSEFNLDDVDDNQETYLYEFLNFLQNWLINHILKVDKLIPCK